MQLTAEEERSLNGEDGKTIASAYRILLAIGAATEAKKLVPIKWAHVSGVNYNTIGDAGIEFLEKNILLYHHQEYTDLLMINFH